MTEPTLCCPCSRWLLRPLRPVGRPARAACDRCGRDEGDGSLTVTVESEPQVMGCPTCGVVAHGHGRVNVVLIDAPWAGRPVRVVWRKRRWVCPVAVCGTRSFVEQDEDIARPRALLTVRACRWAIAQMRREHLRPRARSAARNDVEDGVDLDPAGARGGCRGPGRFQGEHVGGG